MIPEELRSYSALVVAVGSLNHRVNGAVEQLKADMQLVDGSRLQVNEVYIGGQLRKYAYYRLTPSGELLQGWDTRRIIPKSHPVRITFTNRTGFILRRCARCPMYSNWSRNCCRTDPSPPSAPGGNFGR
jgi:hypothetical protein